MGRDNFAFLFYLAMGEVLNSRHSAPYSHLPMHYVLSFTPGIKDELLHTFRIKWYHSLIYGLASRMLVYVIFSKHYSVNVPSSSTGTVWTEAVVMKATRSQISSRTIRNR